MVGNPPRGRKTLILNLRYLAAIPCLGKASGDNLEEKSQRSGTPQASQLGFSLAAPVAKLVPSVLHCFPLNGSHLQGRERDPDIWATQGSCTHCLGMHPEEATSVCMQVEDRTV